MTREQNPKYTVDGVKRTTAISVKNKAKATAKAKAKAAATAAATAATTITATEAAVVVVIVAATTTGIKPGFMAPWVASSRSKESASEITISQGTVKFLGRQ